MNAFHTTNPATGEVVTITVRSVQERYWIGDIGQASGEFAYGQLDEAPWVSLVRHEDGSLTLEAVVE